VVLRLGNNSLHALSTAILSSHCGIRRGACTSAEYLAKLVCLAPEKPAPVLSIYHLPEFLEKGSDAIGFCCPPPKHPDLTGGQICEQKRNNLTQPYATEETTREIIG
jgi:hypothetical protein